MNSKETYYIAFVNSNGRINEIDLGEEIGLTEDETRKILSQLMSEHKIEYAENEPCNYILKKTAKRNRR